MPTKTQVLQAIGSGCDYDRAASHLGIPAGQAYMVATGMPADGGDTFPPDEEQSRPGVLTGSTQHLVYQQVEVTIPESRGDRQSATWGDLARTYDVNSPQIDKIAPVRPRPGSPGLRPKSELDDWVRRRAEADAQMVEAGRSRDAEPGEPEPPAEEEESAADVCQVRTRQHDRVTALMEQLKTIPGASKGGSEVHQSRRKSIVDMMTVELSGHETAEQEHFWPAVRDFFDDGDELAGTALEQEQQGKESLVALGKTDPSDGTFDELADELEMRLRKHVAFEDRVLLRLRDQMAPEEREGIGGRVQRAEKQAPTRPHPHAPKQPAAAVKAAAASAAPLDKARDALGGRPAERRGRAEPRQPQPPPEKPAEEDHEDQ